MWSLTVWECLTLRLIVSILNHENTHTQTRKHVCTHAHLWMLGKKEKSIFISSVKKAKGWAEDALDGETFSEQLFKTIVKCPDFAKCLKGATSDYFFGVANRTHNICITAGYRVLKESCIWSPRKVLKIPCCLGNRSLFAFEIPKECLCTFLGTC